MQADWPAGAALIGATRVGSTDMPGTSRCSEFWPGAKSMSNRHPLHHFDVVAGRVFGWEQAIHLAARSCQALHIALIVRPSSSTWMVTVSPAASDESGLLEVRGYPDIV